MLKIIATFIFIYLVFRVFTYYVLPLIVRWYLHRFKKKFYEQNPHLRQEEDVKSENKTKVKISYKEDQMKSGVDKNIGEYIDFEDLKEDKE